MSVASILSSGSGPWQLSIGSAPSIPPSVSVVNIGQSTLDIKWAATPGAFSYTASAIQQTGGVATVAGVVSGLTASFTGLSPGCLYLVYVVAVNAAGSTQSFPLTVTTDVITVAPAAPAAAAQYNAVGPTTISMSWGAVSGATSYDLTASPGGLTATSPTNSYSWSGLTAGTTYTFTVRSRNAAGTSTATTMTPTQATGAATAPTVTITGFSNVGTTVATVAYTYANAATVAASASNTTTGSVLYLPSQAPSSNGTTVPLTFQGLTPATTYAVAVTGTNSSGTTTTPTSNVTTDSTVEPAINITVSPTYNQSLQWNVTWSSGSLVLPYSNWQVRGYVNGQSTTFISNATPAQNTGGFNYRATVGNALAPPGANSPVPSIPYNIYVYNQGTSEVAYANNPYSWSPT